jgi:hypothetical protein
MQPSPPPDERGWLHIPAQLVHECILDDLLACTLTLLLRLVLQIMHIYRQHMNSISLVSHPGDRTKPDHSRLMLLRQVCVHERSLSAAHLDVKVLWLQIHLIA